jgi:GTP-binding protein
MAAPPLRRPPAEVRFLGSFPGALPPSRLPEIAFVGRSNVGKSSAINRLLGRKAAARVSATPGRTQAINLFDLDGRLLFADLPGYGYAKVSATQRDSWKHMIARYLDGRDTLRLVVALVDSRHPAQPLDLALLTSLQAHARPALVVATKVDKLTRNERLKQLPALTAGLSTTLLPFSAETGEGTDEVWDAIEAAIR